MSATPKAPLFMALACLSFVVGGGAVYWQYSQLEESQAQVESLAKKLKDAKAIENQLKDSAGKLQESSEKLKHLEKGVPEVAYVPTLLTELENVGKQHGIEVLGVRPLPPKADPKAKAGEPGEPKAKKSYEELDIEVKGRGKFASVLQFLAALQTFPKIVAVRTATLTPKRELNDKGIASLDVTVELRAYLFPPSKDDIKLANSAAPAAPSAPMPAVPAQPSGGVKQNGIG